jgi:hypothetical protein
MDFCWNFIGVQANGLLPKWRELSRSLIPDFVRRMERPHADGPHA